MPDGRNLYNFSFGVSMGGKKIRIPEYCVDWANNPAPPYVNGKNVTMSTLTICGYENHGCENKATIVVTNGIDDQKYYVCDTCSHERVPLGLLKTPMNETPKQDDLKPYTDYGLSSYESEWTSRSASGIVDDIKKLSEKIKEEQFARYNYQDVALEQAMRMSAQAFKSLSKSTDTWYGDIYQKGEDTPKVETTHSAVFEIDGLIIEIPAPKASDGWGVAEEVDIYNNDEALIVVNGTKGASWIRLGYKTYYVNHQNGEIMLSEYEIMVDRTPTFIKSITKHQRTIQPPERYQNSEFFPSVPEPAPSNFWIENHEVVYRKLETMQLAWCTGGPLGEYPGADKRPPEPKWSGVWLEGHAPAIKATVE